MILCVGDTTFLDYGSIKVKRKGYSPTGNGGNGLILHSALAVDAELGQPIGLLWQKLWNRESKPKPALDETLEQKKQRQAIARKAARQRPFQEKESYRWVEALAKIEKKVAVSTGVIHIFDASCAILLKSLTVRVNYNILEFWCELKSDRSLDAESERL